MRHKKTYDSRSNSAWATPTLLAVLMAFVVFPAVLAPGDTPARVESAAATAEPKTVRIVVADYNDGLPAIPAKSLESQLLQAVLTRLSTEMLAEANWKCVAADTRGGGASITIDVFRRQFTGLNPYQKSATEGRITFQDGGQVRTRTFGMGSPRYTKPDAIVVGVGGSAYVASEGPACSWGSPLEEQDVVRSLAQVVAGPDQALERKLLWGALKDRDKRLRAGAAVALYRAGAPVEQVIDRLRDTHGEFGYEGVELLRALALDRHPAASDMFMEVIRNQQKLKSLSISSTRMSHKSIMALGYPIWDQVFPRICEGIRSTRCRACLKVLAQSGDPRGATVLKEVWWAEEDYGKLEEIADVLVAWQDPGLTAMLVESLKLPPKQISEDPRVSPSWARQLVAAEALGSLRAQEATEALIARLSTPVAPKAILALGRIGGDRAVAALLAEAEHGGSRTRPEVIRALFSTKDPRTIPLLINEQDYPYRIAHLGDRAVPELDRLLEEGTSLERKRAKSLLKAIREKRAKESRKRANLSRLASERQAASEPAQVRKMIRQLTSRDPVARTAAIRALGESGSPEAVLPLMRFINRRDKQHREQAALALWKLKPVEQIPALTKVVDKVEGSSRGERRRSLLSWRALLRNLLEYVREVERQQELEQLREHISKNRDGHGRG